MKKILSIILSLTLLLSMSVTVFAEEQVVSVSIPDLQYTVTIPADCTIEYKNTGFQSIGKLSVTSTDWSAYPAAKKAVAVNLSSTNGILKNKNGSEISYRVGNNVDKFNPNLGDGSFTCQGDIEMEYFIWVSDWSGAEPGTTYTTKITYNIRLANTWWN